ncbi:MFS general substrate transporter-21 [Coleophoma cylindrospora]|uniref:MFS general substrate transporter-21 n=1 Tax=Coleophoma cylindrospora TaxID=1849047 RepID=A0A3D8SFU9_9HELO|nr:MFS general substrate transporter-21 [Coleophoma cylindrospora]
MVVENTTADAQIILGDSAHLNIDREGSFIHPEHEDTLPVTHGPNYPTEEERRTLRRVAGKLPVVAYAICIVEFAERASYYGASPLFSNYVNRVLPVGGNGYGAPPRGTQQTAGALGMGTVVSSAVSQSFSMLAYCLPLLFGWLADTRTGRWRMICYGIAVIGCGHVIMVASGAKSLLASGHAKIPFFLSVYILSVGSAMFKPNISPTLLDQMPHDELYVKTEKSGERVIVDPEHTTERVMLWFYLLINIGGFMGVPTAYTEKYIGWWLSFLLPLLLYLPLPALLWWLKPKLILSPPGGSDLGNVFRILGICFKRGGVIRIFKGGFFEPAKPTNLAKSSNPIDVPWNDAFVDDVRRSFQATGIFCFFPIQSINDTGLGGAASALSTMLTTNGVPNDVIGNFNSLSIIAMAPVLNYGLYPFLRNRGIHYGPVARMTTGFIISTLGGVGYTVLNYYAYKLGPCGDYGSSATCVDASGVSLVSNISIWWMAIPYALGGISELFVNVPAYGIAYSRAPKNMRGLVSAINLFASAIAYAVGLACSSVIKDPFLTWDFGAPAIIGAISCAIFYWFFRDLDKEEYTLSQNDDRHLAETTGEKVVSETGSAAPEYTEKDTVGVSTAEKTHDKEIGL